MSAGCLGCAAAPATFTSRQPLSPPHLPTLHGSYHEVRPGDTAWRIANSYGLEIDTLAKANQLASPSQLSVGQRLLIPLPQESVRFLWPVLGFVREAGGSSLEITAPAGTLVRASRSGRVAVATRALSGLGKTVVLEHPDGHMTVYARMAHLLVRPGADVRQGMPLGQLGLTPLHFEIRYGAQPKNTLALLPGE